MMYKKMNSKHCKGGGGWTGLVPVICNNYGNILIKKRHELNFLYGNCITLCWETL